MTLSPGLAAAPQAFAAGLTSLRDVLDAPPPLGVSLRVVPAPRRLAPWSVAVAAEVVRDGDDVAGGRLVVLHEPGGQDGWQGDTRVVALVQAQVESEMATDPALAGVGWSWLREALDQRAAAYVASGGTITRTLSTRFGELTGDDQADSCQIEVRASWTAVAGPGGLELGGHLLAWCDLLRSTAGLPPEGVTALRRR